MNLDPVPIDPEPPDSAPGRHQGPNPICPYLSPGDVITAKEAEEAYLAKKALVRTEFLAQTTGPQDPEAS
jgi:hypothetical protein